MRDIKWEIKEKLPLKGKQVDVGKVIDILLSNRGITTKKGIDEFLSPTSPNNISLEEVGIDKREVLKALKRIANAKKNKEKVIIYGDYDADGICATAIMWEVLYALGVDVLPFIPNRFTDGYGLKSESLQRIYEKNPNLRLVITVDNGIVAFDAIDNAKKLGIDVIVTDHHASQEKLPQAHSTVYSTQVCGSVVAWLLTRELIKQSKNLKTILDVNDLLALACIGTIADQMPLLGVNRSVAKYGLLALRKTQRIGFLELMRDARVLKDEIGTYEISFLIAPRINAMGRLSDGLDSLRLLCTKNESKAFKLSQLVSKTNLERQKLVDTVRIHAIETASHIECKGIVCVAHETYHEGIIGLAASKLVEQFGRPAIVISKGEKYSKGSARSIGGLNIVEILRQLNDFLPEVGGHEMAAGFTIETKSLEEFAKRLEELTAPLMTSELTAKKLSIDLELDFSSLTWELSDSLQKFEPVGVGNPAAIFATKKVEVVEKRLIGSDKRHLKLKIRQGEKIFDAIGFNLGENYQNISEGVDIAYNLEVNVWNGSKSLQLKIKDIITNN